MIRLIKKIRALIFCLVKPSSLYWLAIRSTKPLSSKFGFDRGTPIDRFWIEDFLSRNSKLIQGVCLEVTDNYYTVKYGGSKVKKSDVLDIDLSSKKANVHDDLRKLKAIGDNTYDCIILTHVLGIIDDLSSALGECHRVLKPGGTLLATSSCLSPVYDQKANYWRFTPTGFKYLFTKYFPKSSVQISSYGNVLTGQCFWVGMAQEELTVEQLKYNDPKYPCVVAAVVRKGAVQK